MQKRNVLNSPRLSALKRRRRRNLIIKILIFLTLVTGILAGLRYLSRIDRLNITNIEIKDNKVVDTDKMKALVQENLEGNYFWLFPKTNFLIYPKNKIKNELQAQFKTLKDISFSLNNQKTLEISISERNAVYTWCGLVPPPKNDKNQTCYFVDETGFIFDQAPYFSGGVYFKFYGGDFEVKDVPGGNYFYKDVFPQLILFKETLNEMGVTNVALYVKNDGDAVLYLSAPENRATYPEVLLKIDSDFQKIAENLETSLSTEPLQGDFKKKYSSLIYLDLRFGNKVYYKFE